MQCRAEAQAPGVKGARAREDYAGGPRQEAAPRLCSICPAAEEGWEEQTKPAETVTQDGARKTWC